MSIELIAAQDELFGIVKTAFDASVVGLDPLPELFYPGDLVGPPPVDEIYATVYYVVPVENKVGIGQAQGKSLYEASGLLTISFYAPKQQSSALRVIEQLGSTMRDAFRSPSPSGEIWFRNQRCTPVGGNATMNQVNVVTTCTYQTEK